MCESGSGCLGPPVPDGPYGLCGRKATEVCESGGGCLGLPVPDGPYGLCGRKATLNSEQELCESGGGCLGLPVPDGPYGLCGRKATLNSEQGQLRRCVKVEVAAWGSPSLMVPTVSVDVKQP